MRTSYKWAISHAFLLFPLLQSEIRASQHSSVGDLLSKCRFLCVGSSTLTNRRSATTPCFLSPAKTATT